MSSEPILIEGENPPINIKNLISVKTPGSNKAIPVVELTDEASQFFENIVDMVLNDSDIKTLGAILGGMEIKLPQNPTEGLSSFQCYKLISSLAKAIEGGFANFSLDNIVVDESEIEKVSHPREISLGFKPNEDVNWGLESMRLIVALRKSIGGDDVPLYKLSFVLSRIYHGDLKNALCVDFFMSINGTSLQISGYPNARFENLDSVDTKKVPSLNGIKDRLKGKLAKIFSKKF